MKCINIRPDQIGTEKKENCKFTNVQVLNLLVLFPFFVVRNAYRYSGSSLSRLFCCEKDMFYRFMNDGDIKWRKLLYAMNSPSFVLKYTLTPNMAPAKVSPCAIYQSSPSVTSPLVKNEMNERTTPDITMMAAELYWIHSLLFVVIDN